MVNSQVPAIVIQIQGFLIKDLKIYTNNDYKILILTNANPIIILLIVLYSEGDTEGTLKNSPHSFY